MKRFLLAALVVKGFDDDDDDDDDNLHFWQPWYRSQHSD
jgi:hypothetical protein